MVIHKSGDRKIPVRNRPDFRSITDSGLRMKSTGGDPGQSVDPVSPDTERVGHPVEEREKGDDVNGFGDLGFRPALRAQGVGIVGGHSGRIHGQLAGIFQKCGFGFREAWQSGIEIASGQRIDEIGIGLLRPQEASVRIRSVAALVQGGDERGQHFLDAVSQMAVAKMQPFGKGDDITKEVRPVREALENVRHGRPAGVLSEPLRIGIRSFTRG